MAVSNPTRGNGSNEKKMTPEIYFARKLASNDKKIRDKTLKKLRKWIAARSSVPDAFQEEELMKLWKGLFYCMWMSDKPLVQEDLAEMISSLVHCVADRKTGLQFVDAALKIMARDWPGIDVWRMDKFLMFVRRIVRHSLEYISNEGWKEEEVTMYADMLSNTIINANQNATTIKVPIGLQLHFINLFPEELAKAGGSNLSSPVILKLLEPFIKCLAISNDFRLRKDIIEHVFIYLIKQSDEGIEYEGGGDAVPNKASKNKNKTDGEPQTDKAEENDEDAEEPGDDGGESDNGEMEEEGGNPDWGAKDPRAGGVDVVLPQLQPSYSDLANMFFQMASEKTVRSKNRKAMYRLVQWFKDLASGVYPLAVQMPEVGPGLTPKMMKNAARAYIKEELTLSEQRALEKELGKKKNKKINQFSRGNLGTDEGSDIDDEEDAQSQSDEMDDSELDSENDGEFSDIEDEADTEDNDEDEPEENNKPLSMKETAKTKPALTRKPKPIAQTFEVEDDWEDEESSNPPQTVVEAKQAIQQLKKKLKASKRPLSSGWTESPLANNKRAEKEIEIVIPNKRAKTKEKNPESPKMEEATPNGNNRRVKIVLNRNTAQDPKDYQESIRKSPGLPHDPDKQPSGGGVLKRTSAAASQKLAFNQPKRSARARKV